MHQLRIISGSYGGRLIKTPATRATHPMGDRERSAIFNALQNDVMGATVLDAFAGSGAIGLEALSRGAKEATFLENHKKAQTILRENIQKLAISSQTKIITTPSSIKDNFDIILADPPYDKPQYAIITKLLKHLTPSGIFILSHAKNSPPPSFANLALISDKTYASAQIKIYRNY